MKTKQYYQAMAQLVGYIEVRITESEEARERAQERIEEDSDNKWYLEEKEEAEKMKKAFQEIMEIMTK